jgi:hypothetical protein
MGRKRTLTLIGSLLVTGMFAACSCDKDPLGAQKPGMCDPTFKCKTGFDYRLGVCKASRCAGDPDCCPGQKCNSTTGFCGDQYTSCNDDATCSEVPGQTCIDFRGGKYCGYPNTGNHLSMHQTQSCTTNNDCDAGRTCFGSRCVVNAPCMGGCAANTPVCDVDSNTCFALADCKMQCAQGQMLVVADPDTESGPHCCKVSCKCETLPPLPPGQIGWYASLGISKTEVLVSAYDQTYGDLVLAHFGLDAKPGTIEYLDGFPTSGGAIVANPNGPRGGRADPGDNVGMHTSLAVDGNGTVHIAYYDKTNGHLKYANNTGGKWNISVVDTDGDSGAYTSLAIGPNGSPHISYMMVEGTVGADPTKVTALKYASAANSNPGSPSDWTVKVLDSKPLPIPPCNGACPMGQECVDTGMGPTCTPTTMGCMMCQSTEACVDVSGTPTCKATIPLLAIDDLVPGVGLFSSLAFTSTGTPFIAYYDRLARDLRLAVGRPDGSFMLRTLDGGDMMHPKDVGQHASLAVGPMDVIGIAYVDFTKDNLVYTEVVGNQVTREVVDNGVTAPDIRLVGPDASLIYDAGGRPAIAYQDPTEIDLLYARRTGSPPLWSTEVLRGGPPMMSMMGMKGMASGFYASQRRLDMKAYISNVDTTFDMQGNLVLKLSVVTKDLL